ncbi:MAG: hypothetical protein U0521_05480 [Anaerolineae bacterium]
MAVVRQLRLHASKTMIAAPTPFNARRGGDFGFCAGEVVADFPRIVERRTPCAWFDAGRSRPRKAPEHHLYRDYAAFEAPHSVVSAAT